MKDAREIRDATTRQEAVFNRDWNIPSLAYLIANTLGWGDSSSAPDAIKILRLAAISSLEDRLEALPEQDQLFYRELANRGFVTDLYDQIAQLQAENQQLVTMLASIRTVELGKTARDAIIDAAIEAVVKYEHQGNDNSFWMVVNQLESEINQDPAAAHKLALRIEEPKQAESRRASRPEG